MADNARVGILDYIEDTVGLFFHRHFESAVNAGDHKIECAEHTVGIVERSVLKNVGFDAFQNTKPLAVSLVQPVSLAMLLGDLIERQTACVVGGYGMFRNAKYANPRSRVASAIVSSVSAPSEAAVWQ